MKYVRDPKRVYDCLSLTPEGRVVARREIYIQIPVRFSERKLAFIGKESVICGICAFVTPDNFYGVSLINASFTIKPSSSEVITINGDDYHQFGFVPGDTVMEFTDLVKDDKILFPIYDEIMQKGNVPWYISYLDMGDLFSTAAKHAGANVGNEQEVIQLLASILARDPNDKSVFFRQTLTSMQDLLVKEPAFIPLRNIQYGATNTVDKISGSYWSVGLASAIASPSKRVENNDYILRQ